VEQFLEQEEARALQRVTASVERLGDDVCAASSVRERIRRHPLTAVGLGAVLGFVAGPPLLHAFQRLLGSSAGRAVAASNRSGALLGIVGSSLRSLRGGR
jgi:hypothetical protein